MLKAFFTLLDCNEFFRHGFELLLEFLSSLSLGLSLSKLLLCSLLRISQSLDLKLELSDDYLRMHFLALLNIARVLI